MTINNKDIEGRLICSRKPNCVSSVAVSKTHYLPPISYNIANKAARKSLVNMLQANPNAQIIENHDDYVHATFTTKFFQFVDDVEFIFDKEVKQIHFRSRSRIGYYDFGANRKRMQAITNLLSRELWSRQAESNR